VSADRVAVIGAGPAGIAAAIQLNRFGLHAVVVEKHRIGGLLSSANLVENYPGFPAGISGPSLVNLFEEQLRNTTAEIIFEEVVDLRFENQTFCLVTDKRTLHAAFVIVASGTRPIELSGLQIPDGTDNAIHYDINPILAETGKRIVIIGAGDAAFDYALNLGKRNQVHILNRGTRVRCIPILWQRAIAMSTIAYSEETEALHVHRDSQGELSLECRSGEKGLWLNADHLVFAIGREPQLGFLSGFDRTSLTELERDGLIHFAGDVKNGSLRQTAIAIGDGAAAAMKIHAKLAAIPQKMKGVE
jgi:thioredoxin reductase (NADPH)